MKNSSQQSSLVDGEDNVQELEDINTDLDKEATEALAKNEQDLDSSKTSKSTMPGNHSDNNLKEGTNTANPSKSSNLNFLDMIMSQFQSEEGKAQESLEEDVCPICMEEYGKICHESIDIFRRLIVYIPMSSAELQCYNPISSTRGRLQGHKWDAM
jgi:hypothetical protein